MRRHRMRRAARWIGAVLCAGMIVIATASLRWTYVRLIDASGEDWSILIDFCGGAVEVTWRPSGGGINPYRMDDDFHSWNQLASYWRDLALLPSYWTLQRPFSLASLTIPLWIPFVAIGVPTGWLWWIDRTRRSFSSFPRSRARLVLACISLAISAVILAVGCGRCETDWSFADREITLGTANGSFYAIGRGVIDARWWEKTPPGTPPGTTYPRMLMTPRTLWSIAFPSWIPAILIGIVALYVWRGNRHPDPSLCETCHYNLTGNTSGICPECGQPASSTA